MKRLHFQVSITVPNECTRTDVSHYIEDAVRSQRGMLDPADPLAHIEKETVRVKFVQED